MDYGMRIASFLTHAIYANGVTMDISDEFPNGVKWYGTEGSLFGTRDEQVSPTASPGDKAKVAPLVASNPGILDSVIGPDEIHLYPSAEQHGVHSYPQAAASAGRDRPQVLLNLPAASYRNEDQRQIALGS